MKLYKGKCLTRINSDACICLYIFNFLICYCFSALCPVDVQGMLFRYNTFCCGYSNVMIVFASSEFMEMGWRPDLFTLERKSVKVLSMFSVGNVCLMCALLQL